ncbi:MAG TPA: TonB-dependent receptor [Rhizomicrobium sp.]|nr:TonB-dependent receptor [Rhizomicrobium sp.]
MHISLKQTLLVGSSVAAFALSAGQSFAQSASQEAETVIVTGTRVQGMTAADSAAPIQVLGTDALVHGTGSADLRQQLGQTVPSFTAQQFGGDTANLTLSAALRGLSPNDTLVLVNGHRRHYTGNFHVDGGYGAGSASADLSMIPSAAIDHVEVLLDGAAAQYGTDAIAGVVNIILKNKSSGGSLSATIGDYYDRGDFAGGNSNGAKYDVSYNMGLPLFDKGFVNFTVEKQYQNFTQYGGADSRYVNNLNQPVAQTTVTGVGTNGVATLGTVGNQIPNSFLASTTGYPRNNSINGNLEYQLTMAEMNSEYDFSDNFSIYAFGTIGHKFGKSYENDRLPNQIIATMGSNQPCSASNPNGYLTGSSTPDGTHPNCLGPYAIDTTNGFAAPPGTPGAGLNPVTGQIGIAQTGNAGNLFSSTLTNARTGAALPTATGETALGTTPELVLYPNGFRPLEAIKEDDYQYNIGEKFNLAGWAVDADVGYGKDIDNVYTLNSANRTLFIDTHTTPTNFYDGSFTASQFTGTIDAVHPFNVGMASPLTVAIGAEAREDTYGIGAGEPLSYYNEGAQSFPGYSPPQASTHSRKNYAGYIDLAVAPIEALQIDVAGRAEHYTDFGDTQIGKVTVRYDFNPQWAVRGTVSTGFRAPTLSEEFYNAVNVSPAAATVQLPADSASAQLLGLTNLKPESSTSYSLGIVAHPLEDLSATVDVYSIAIGNRIVNSATVTSAGGAINVPVVATAVSDLGLSLDPTATQQGVTAFLNGISTLTQGVDATVNYPTDFGDKGLVNWTLAGNYNTTHTGRTAAPPSVILASNPSASFFTPYSVFAFDHQTPVIKVGLTADWTLDQYGATVRETFWGPDHGYTSPNAGGEEIPANQAGVGITDLEGRYNITDQLQFAIGANNVFNIKPDVYGAAPNCASLPSNVTIVSGGSCKAGPNQSNGEVQTASNNSVYQAPLGSFFDPNGGYYYARISYNF